MEFTFREAVGPEFQQLVAFQLQIQIPSTHQPIRPLPQYTVQHDGYLKPSNLPGLAQTPGFWGLRSPEGIILRQGIPVSIFSGGMPFYKRAYSPGQPQFITTSTYRQHPREIADRPTRGLRQPAAAASVRHAATLPDAFECAPDRPLQFRVPGAKCRNHLFNTLNSSDPRQPKHAHVV